MNKQKEINEMMDRVRENFITNYPSKHYFDVSAVIHILDLMKEKINKIYKENDDTYIRW